MDFAFSPEQEQLRGFTREFLDERYGDAALTQVADAEGVDPRVWPRLAELGWFDPELTFLDTAVLLEETGRRLLPAPYFSTVALAGPALGLDDGLAKRVAAGGLRAGLAWAEEGVPQGLLDTDALSTRADGDRISGRKILVPDGAAVELFVVVARDSGGPGLYAVEASDAQVVARGGIDATRRPATVELRDAPARPLATGDQAYETLARIREVAHTAAALEAVGVAQRALDLLTEHARTRYQFGKPIGVYQAVSHKASDIYVALQEGRSLAYWAAWCVSEGDPMARQAALAAKAAAGEAAVLACEQAIQGHGGIGFTWEHVLHRYYKRAQWLAAFDGPARAQRAELAGYLLD